MIVVNVNVNVNDCFLFSFRIRSLKLQNKTFLFSYFCTSSASLYCVTRTSEQSSLALANCSAVFSYFSLWICYETQLTNAKIKMRKKVDWVGQLTTLAPISREKALVRNQQCRFDPLKENIELDPISEEGRCIWEKIRYSDMVDFILRMLCFRYFKI